MVNDWLGILAAGLGAFEPGIMGLARLIVLAVAAFMVFLVVYAHGVKPEPNRDGRNRKA